MAGNHDATIRLAAGREFLGIRRVHVFGLFQQDLKQQIVHPA